MFGVQSYEMCTHVHRGLNGAAGGGYQRENVGQLLTENLVLIINTFTVLTWIIPKPFTLVFVESLICTQDVMCSVV